MRKWKYGITRSERKPILQERKSSQHCAILLKDQVEGRKVTIDSSDIEVMAISGIILGSEGWREKTKLEMGKVSGDRFYSHLFKKLSQEKMSKMRNILLPKKMFSGVTPIQSGCPFPQRNVV